ncbi:RES domain-containing protein [Paraburkholderia silviterrae]|uniref:RES domain-containing protein n=1 Tax=Paraburkholderia silviterrae TaxID=2528715 RepID=A0A4V2ZYM7_9BURK|nr:RES domain-containing protein [Paraburkholderia silviterrae]TDG21174.1 RES domain-containing protein [Paraburkholderia silviterrae]
MTKAPMSNKEEVKCQLPRELEGLVPTAGQILKALGEQNYTYEADRIFVRAVDDPRYVGTASPFRAHRFGPPIELVGDDGKLPFTWVYLGMDSLVAAWESQLVLNNRGAGNGFHITRNAEEVGVLASIQFPRPLVLWNLGEDHSSRLGFQDAISERDHEACQWFGLRMREAMLLMPEGQRPDGFVYPSHRVKGYPALALADWAAAELFADAKITIEQFVDSVIYARFRDDPMRTPPPELDAR